MSSKQQAKRLGRGLSSLISADLGRPSSISSATPEGVPSDQSQGPARGTNPESPAPARVSASSGHVHARFQSLPVDAIRQNPLQPRKQFDEISLVALSQSLRDRGTLQPIVVRPVEGGYELVAGERRLRAAKRAGLVEIPAIIRPVADDQMLELALIENIQRAELNPVERAKGYRQLHLNYHLSHEQIAAKMGEDRATVTNYLRLLSLPEQILESLAKGSLTAGHAKALLAITNSGALLSLAERIEKEGWSVRRVEAEAGRLQNSSKEATPAAGSEKKRPAVQDMEESFSRALGLRVTIKEGGKPHTGRLTIEYYNLNDFERLARLLGADAERP